MTTAPFLRTAFTSRGLGACPHWLFAAPAAGGPFMLDGTLASLKVAPAKADAGPIATGTGAVGAPQLAAGARAGAHR